MATVKLYNSEVWMRRQYVTLRKKPEEIAERAGCSTMTVYRKLREFGLLK